METFDGAIAIERIISDRSRIPDNQNRARASEAYIFLANLPNCGTNLYDAPSSKPYIISVLRDSCLLLQFDWLLLCSVV
jgi:hypothetical protein